jgi:hypothetical protein
MNEKRIDPYYCTLDSVDLDMLGMFIERFGYEQVFKGVAAVLAQRIGMASAPQLSFCLGQAVGAARDVDHRVAAARQSP